ncbi:MAG: DNA mismatch repair protein MutS [Oscillospiraceae bacterium]|nr:DNA mismatch repair protein MutS [Oscillospiraceae bacterium]
MNQDKQNLTPTLRQYLEIKEQHPNYILFYQLGDFYELFFEDAVNISKELSLTLTARGDTPMCGVPIRSAETYIQRLIKAGYKVATCDQLETPTADGKFEREVTRLITPGTLTQDAMLDESKNNYIMAFFTDPESEFTGIACGDLSTGVLHIRTANDENGVINQIARFTPAEVLFNTAFMNFKKAGEFLKTRTNALAELSPDEQFVVDLEYIEKQLPLLNSLRNQNRLRSVNDTFTNSAIIALIRYVLFTQKAERVNFNNIVFGESENTSDSSHSDYKSANLEIGASAHHNLELTETIRTREKRGTLLWVLDRAKTAMGKRRLRQLILEPYVDHLTIVKRLGAVEEFTLNTPKLGTLRDCLTGIYDLERLVSRVVYRTSTPRDIYALGRACESVPILKGGLVEMSSPLLAEINDSIDELSDVFALIENAITPEPPVNAREGGFVIKGFNAELDRLRSLSEGGEELIAKIENQERTATGVHKLKVGYNRVFGYYIEIPKSSVPANLPERYFRTQTLTNAERFTTDELKKIEDEILSAKERAIEIEQAILKDIRAFIESELDKIQCTARGIAEIDVLCSLADVAVRENYCRPEITLDNIIDIKESRHPVVEKMKKILSTNTETVDTAFIPNDCYLDGDKNSQARFAIITGPNMAGKSTYMRQIALMVIMAQIGSFVPAKSARLGICDQIFTRVGASDDLSAGQSTFMVEMLEVAELLKRATSRSFVVLDEIGRGTSTFDGLAIAKAVSEYLNNKVGCKTLFATHYHELIQLEKHNVGIVNFSVSVSKKGDELTFLHKIVSGGSVQSYGIEVAKLAGVPNAVIANSKKFLTQMETHSKTQLEEQLHQETEEETQIDFKLLNRENALNRIKALDLENMTGLNALAELSEIKKLLN